MRVFNLPPRTILPLIIVTAMLMVGVRLDGVWSAITEGTLYTAIKKVSAADPAKEGEKKPEAPKAEEKKPDIAAPAPAKPEEKKTESAPAEAPPARQPAVKGNAASPESDLYKQLMGRREQLDKRAQELDSREALTLVAEKRIDQKIKEMEALRAQLQALVGQASEAQVAQIENLVKIYEIMKPKEAAKIFESLEMPILLGVVQKMKPARTAAVLAEMNPEKAKEVTTALTKRDQLPEVK